MGTFFDLRPKPGRVALLVAVLAALTFTAVAWAQSTTTTVPLAFTIPHPCTFEPVAYEGSLHSQTHLKEDGSFHGEVNFQRMDGIGLVSGAKYVASHAESTTFNVQKGSVFNMELMSHQIRQKDDGTLVLGDDFKVKTRIQAVVNANGVLTVNKFDVTTDTCQ